MSKKHALLTACIAGTVGLAAGTPAASAMGHYGESYTFSTYGGCSGTVAMKAGSGKRWAVGSMVCGADMSYKGLSVTFKGPGGSGSGLGFMLGSSWPTIGLVTTTKVNAVPGSYTACVDVKVSGPRRGNCTAYRYR